MPDPILWDLNARLRGNSSPAAFGIRDSISFAGQFGLTNFIWKSQVPTKKREGESLEVAVTQPVSDIGGKLWITTDKELFIDLACWEGHFDTGMSFY